MVSGPWLSSSGAGRQSSGSGNRRLAQSALVSASVGCLRRKAALGLPEATGCSEPQLLSPAGGGQFLRGWEQLGHRRLACRMTGCFLDDLPQAVPRSGMGALIDDEDAVRAGRATTLRHANRVLPRWRPGPPEIS